LRTDHRYERFPETAYEKLCHFATHWPNRYEQLKRHRTLIETAFQATKTKFGDRLTCRDPTARENEIMAKQVAHNIRMLVLRQVVASSEF
jgi:transposase